ncbi:Pycsar system effector family protein [Paeniglutamicibacter gangotriensis]|uniref:Pycsar system effector family protein n=1 Tax=Paeniglutamicibacter gangotriensis TaxID=254787 RepID=UPI00374451CD
MLLLGAGLAALVVTPRLRTRSLASEASSNFIYFGHARLWSPEALAEALGSTSLLPQISRQIIHMAEIAWVKHIRVQWSFRLGVLGAFVLFVFTCAVAY